MNELSYKEKLIYLIIFALITVSYVIGFAMQENSAGGALVDFENTKRNLFTFDNNNFLNAIKSTASLDPQVFQSTRAPGFYVFNKYLNPFTHDPRLHQLFSTIVSLLIPLFLFLGLKIKFKEVNIYHLAFFSTIIILSPYFRSTAFWGNEENFGILIVAISSYFYLKYFERNSVFNEWIYLFALGIFSSLTVYCDQKLIIIPFFTYLTILFSNKSTKNKLFITFFYIVAAIPFIFLIKLWGNIVPTGDASRRVIKFSLDNLNFHYFLYSLSIIAFYLFPFFFLLNNKSKNIFLIFKTKENLFLTFIFFLFLFYFVLFYDLKNFSYLGGGIFDKASKLLFQNLFLQKIFLSIVFIFSWLVVLIFKGNSRFNFLILIFFPIFSLLISPALFQEYFDPLIFFIILIYLKNRYLFNIKTSLFIFLYFLFFLFSIIIFYY